MGCDITILKENSTRQGAEKCIDEFACANLIVREKIKTTEPKAKESDHSSKSL